MYKTIFSTVTFFTLLLMVVFNLIIWFITDKNTVFGVSTLASASVQSLLQQLLLFSPTEWTNSYGLSLLLSILFHSSVGHLLTNLVMLAVILFACEKKIGGIRGGVLFLLIHLSTLFVITVVYNFIGYETQVFFSGASSATLGLLGFYLVFTKKWIACVLCLSLLMISQNNFSNLSLERVIFIDPHLLGFIIGMIGAKLYPSRMILQEKTTGT